MKEIMFMVRYQSNNNGEQEIYFEFLSEAREWVRNHGGEIWKKIV